MRPVAVVCSRAGLYHLRPLSHGGEGDGTLAPVWFLGVPDLTPQRRRVPGHPGWPRVLQPGFLLGESSSQLRVSLRAPAGRWGLFRGSQARPPPKASPLYATSGTSLLSVWRGRLGTSGGQTPGRAPLPTPSPWQLPLLAKQSEKFTGSDAGALPHLFI